MLVFCILMRYSETKDKEQDDDFDIGKFLVNNVNITCLYDIIYTNKVVMVVIYVKL